MSGGLAPSKSTVYVSNLPYSLTNNDLHKVFSEYGKVVKVTVMKDRVTRKSKGVAFVLFLKRDDAHTCSKILNGKEMFGRTLKASIASDNGRSAQFIRRRDYPDKSKCYECGEEGHLSYKCPHNVLGERQPPPKKQRIRKKKNKSADDRDNSFYSDDEVYEPDMETLSAAIALDQEEADKLMYEYKVAAGEYSSITENPKTNNQKKFRQNEYFSDEEEID